MNFYRDISLISYIHVSSFAEWHVQGGSIGKNLTMVPRTLRPGVYAPLPTFFDDNQEIDYVSYKKHLLSTESK